ncbi:hypothetical protein JWF35_03595 [Clostridium botulinum]|uniref:hypothetical protein n=1 Tax=Clostridium botulinum TaxID=1491 RepID=UPI00015920B6|nr:hypothetical protein [Clostridium botulinum]ABS35780.1 conserved hypothetical protein [Clostridium botulinum A str. ATCC 19397]MBO3438191.1 hypothetical protein [Clostridium botulinum]QRC52152.1 hypothetical protein JMA41_13920 [Clostridium botulinum]
MTKNTQTEANKKWYEKNKDHAKYLNKRSHARSFIKNFATSEDLKELKSLMKEREENLK